MFIFRNNRNNPLKMKHSGWLSVILLIVLINLGQRVARLSKTCGKCEWNGKLTRFLDCVQTDKVGINMLCFSTSYGLENVTGLAFFCRTKAGPGRAAKQEQDENSRNHIQAF